MSPRQAFGVDKEYPYSKVIKADGFIYIKSHVGIDPETDTIPEGITEQTTLTLGWLVRALEYAGGSPANFVRINIYLAHIEEDFDAMDVAYGSYMAAAGIDRPPARTTIGSALSWPELRIQMDAIAVE